MEAPIFIVGAPRSGTTLLRNMFNRHPRIAICGETHFHHYVYARRQAFGDLIDPKNRQRVVEEYLGLRRLRWVADRAVLSEKLMRDGTSYQALFTSLVKYHAESQGKQRWGEKTPQHALFSETLCEWYPGATLIHMIRDPRDVVASLQRMSWAGNSVVQNARTWRKCSLAAQRCSHLPQYLPVCYETLVSQPERELRRICERIGEEYDPFHAGPGEANRVPIASPLVSTRRTANNNGTAGQVAGRAHGKGSVADRVGGGRAHGSIWISAQRGLTFQLDYCPRPRLR